MVPPCESVSKVIPAHRYAVVNAVEQSNLHINDSDLCVRYVEGAMDAYDTMQGLSWSNPSKWICAPDNMQVEQAVRVFLKYADNHPEDLHYPAANVVWLAMHDAFPCPAK